MGSLLPSLLNTKQTAQIENTNIIRRKFEWRSTTTGYSTVGIYRLNDIYIYIFFFTLAEGIIPVIGFKIIILYRILGGLPPARYAR